MLQGLTRLLILIAGVLSIQCASRGTVWRQPGETYPAKAFTLQLRVSPIEATVGDPLSLEYVLTNTTEQAVAACADSWSNYHMWGTRSEKGQATINFDAVPPESIFRIPPRASLVWRVDIKTPDVGTGSATIRGILHSSCSLWSGSVVSEPVTVTIRPGAP